MPNLLRFLSITVLLTIGLIPYFLVIGALFPQRVARTKSVIDSMPGRSFGIGLVNFVFFAVLALVLFSIGEKTSNGFVKGMITIPALLILAFLATLLSFGFAGTTHLLGERIFPILNPWKQSVWGSVCLSIACALPLVGWFLLLPYSGFVGVGAVILAFFQRGAKM
jgi:hypothetical protein